MLENKYSVFVCTKNIKVEIAASNFDGEAISKLSNYVIEVVDNLIGTSKCWFTVLNAKVLMDEVCSLVVRKFEINSNNANEKHKKFLLLCFCVKSPKGLEIFEPEIEDFSVALYNTYINTPELLCEQIECWYDNCLNYACALVKHFGDAFENILYWACLRKKIISEKFMSEFFIFNKYCKISLKSINDTFCSGEIFAHENSFNKSETTDFLRKVTSHICADTTENPILIKYIVIRCLEEVSKVYEAINTNISKSSRDYLYFYTCYLNLKLSPHQLLLVEMLKEFNRDCFPVSECISVIEQHIKNNLSFSSIS